MTKLQTILTTLLLACIINAKILVLDMEDLRQLTASKNPNLLRSLLNSGKAAHKEKVCYDANGQGWAGDVNEKYRLCSKSKCINQRTGLSNTRPIKCRSVE